MAGERGVVLVVEDDRKLARIVVRMLERAGYRCVTGASADQALRAVDEHHPDAIVLDVMIPGPTGIEVCRHLRADGWVGGVIMISARSSPADRATATAAGADAFLGKPFPLAQLVSTVDNVVRPH
ncbi:response regulator transcription factor [Micromonospora deserti]|uniref:response regulator transcription factor n=1 Tax=Micromonospora deserti TaxID=2070366 RepID=UPI0013141164|nr:response regulator [Micromonospora deserti]